MIVLDASAAVAWLLHEPGSAPVVAGLVISQRVIVPAHWPLEVGHAVLKALRQRRISENHLLIIAREFQTLDLMIAPQIELSEFLSLLRFAQLHGLSMYDAGYVDLALTHGASLATLDNGMRKAAESVGVLLAL